MNNIVYSSSGFADFYGIHRHQWDEYYESEKCIMDTVFSKYDKPFSVLDVGCGCGGLGVALSKRYDMKRYKGIDINAENIKVAKDTTSKDIQCDNEFELIDISEDRTKGGWDTVVSFSCVDFNVDVDGMIKSCWEKVDQDGYFISSFRLTNLEGVNDIEKSFQWVGDHLEKANYVVFNYHELFRTILSLGQVKSVEAYGYWREPASSAVTGYDRLCFSVVAVRKESETNNPTLNLKMPMDLFMD